MSSDRGEPQPDETKVDNVVVTWKGYNALVLAVKSGVYFGGEITDEIFEENANRLQMTQNMFKKTVNQCVLDLSHVRLQNGELTVTRSQNDGEETILTMHLRTQEHPETWRILEGLMEEMKRFEEEQRQGEDD